jgi:hypothetical protein
MIRRTAAAVIEPAASDALDEVLDVSLEEALVKGLLVRVPLDDILGWLETGEATPTLEPVLHALDEGKPCGTLS